jgi:secreted trypsin-like serine protease
MKEVLKAVLLLLATSPFSVSSKSVANSTSKYEARVYGGIAVVKPFTWMVSLQKNGKHYCGATLVDSSWVCHNQDSGFVVHT